MTTGDLDDNDTLEPLLSVLRRRWRIIVVCLLLGLAASIALSKAQQNEYTASASILFRDPGIDQQLFGYSAFSPSTDQPSQAATNIALVSLPTVESRTSAALHMSSEAVRSAISVSGVGQANIAQINATAPDPALAARIATTYAQQYVLFSQEAARAQISGHNNSSRSSFEALPPAERDGTVGQGLRTRANEPDRAFSAANRQRRGRAASSRSDVAFCSAHQAQRGDRRLHRSAAGIRPGVPG